MSGCRVQQLYAFCSDPYSKIKGLACMRIKRFAQFGFNQKLSESKLCANVLTPMFYAHTVLLHNKQGGRGRHILPD